MEGGCRLVDGGCSEEEKKLQFCESCGFGGRAIFALGHFEISEILAPGGGPRDHPNNDMDLYSLEFFGVWGQDTKIMQLIVIEIVSV